jgi:16S rRNA (adenine1518-N6/adenine1519-N6)-dimethyltransferase
MELTNLSEIRAVLSRHGFRFSKAMGQNFLVASWVPERIAAEAGIDEGTGVLEVGPGIGALTVRLAERAGQVLCLELDRTLEPVLRETLGGYENVELLFGDALKTNLPALVRERFAGLRPVVCANLPYNITTPLLAAFLEAGCFESCTVMVQREVARRLCAVPGTGDYGAFTVYVQWNAQAELLFDVSPGCFIPPPKVTSSVLRLKRRTAPPCGVRSEAYFFRVVRAAFGQRRKTLPNALSAGLPGLSKREAEAAVSSLGMDLRIRGEQLGIPAFAALSDVLFERQICNLDRE